MTLTKNLSEVPAPLLESHTPTSCCLEVAIRVEDVSVLTFSLLDLDNEKIPVYR